MISICCFCCNSKKVETASLVFFLNCGNNKNLKQIGIWVLVTNWINKRNKINTKIQICEEFDSIVAALLDNAAGETGKNLSQTASEPSSHV